MNRLRLPVVVIALSAIVLAGCGDDEGSGGRVVAGQQPGAGHLVDGVVPPHVLAHHEDGPVLVDQPGRVGAPGRLEGLLEAAEQVGERAHGVRVERRPDDLGDRLAADVAAVEADLGERGRVLVRPSGTEPLVRVMVEAPTAEAAEAATSRLVAAVESACR